jgi:hypothetical protein
VIGLRTARDVPDPPDDGGVFRTRYRTRPGLPPPYPEVLWPSSLLNGFSLELAGRAQVAGRPALRVIATPAPGVWRADEHGRPERIEVTADAETGILVRFEEFFDGRTVRLTELTDVMFSPPGEFKVPDDADDDGEETASGSRLFSGPRWAAARTAANVLGTAVGAAARHAPQPPRETAARDDPEAAMPAADGRFDPAAAGSPVGDELLRAMHRSGRAQFSGTLHQWLDAAVCGRWAQAKASAHGWDGIGSAAGALGDRVGASHQVTRVAIGADGRYRLDYLRGRRKHRPRTVACDGSRCWREYDDRVVVGPVLPLPEVTEMVDTAVLLAGHVSAVAETRVDGRRGLALRAAADGPDPWAVPAELKESDLVVDAELGIILRLAQYAGDAQVMRREFRGVAPLPADGGESVFAVPAGVRVEHTDGWLLDQVDMPAGARAAIRSAGSAAKAAYGFLSSLRRRLAPEAHARI